MAPELKKANLQGYKQLLNYLTELQELNEAYAKVPNEEVVLSKVGRVEGFCASYPLITGDGFGWRYGLHFHVKGRDDENKILVLFPRRFLVRRVPLSRSIGVYYQGNISDEDIAKVLNDIKRTF